MTAPDARAADAAPLVVAEQVRKSFRTGGGLFSKSTYDAVRGVDLEVHAGELLALVGQSGSGKSTMGRMLVRLMQPTGGRILFDQAEIGTFRRKQLQAFRRRAQIVFQNPYMSLDPRMTVGDTLNEVLHVWDIALQAEWDRTVASLLDMVRLPASYRHKQPHELSGGERQRVAIARAMAVKPEFLVADEVVSALDVSVAAQVVNVILELNESNGLACLFITHDLHLARAISDRVAVMKEGEIVETGPADAVFERPQHEYTRALVDAQLVVGGPHTLAAPEPGAPHA